MLVDGPTFERLLYVWEFFNNFSDFFELATFKLEELHAALSFAQDGKPIFEASQSGESAEKEEEEIDWEDYISNKTVGEQGFGLLNTLHIKSIECFFKEVKNQAEDKQGNN
jgi:hypothetical protein